MLLVNLLPEIIHFLVQRNLLASRFDLDVFRTCVRDLILLLRTIPH